MAIKRKIDTALYAMNLQPATLQCCNIMNTITM